MAKSDPVAFHDMNKDMSSEELTTSKDDLIQGIAAQCRPEQEIIGRPVPVEGDPTAKRIGLYVEDPKKGFFQKGPKTNERTAAAQIIEGAAPEYFNFKRQELANEAMSSGKYRPSADVREIDQSIRDAKLDCEKRRPELKQAYDEALSNLGRGETEEEKAVHQKAFDLAKDDLQKLEGAEAKFENRKLKTIQAEVWKGQKLTGADVHAAAKVNLLVQAGVLERGTAINADVAQNLDGLIKNIPGLQKMQEKGAITQEGIKANVKGAIATAEKYPLTQKMETKQAKESVRDKLRSFRKDKAESPSQDVSIPKGPRVGS